MNLLLGIGVMVVATLILLTVLFARQVNSTVDKIADAFEHDWTED